MDADESNQACLGVWYLVSIYFSCAVKLQK